MLQIRNMNLDYRVIHRQTLNSRNILGKSAVFLKRRFRNIKIDINLKHSQQIKSYLNKNK